MLQMQAEHSETCHYTGFAAEFEKADNIWPSRYEAEYDEIEIVETPNRVAEDMAFVKFITHWFASDMCDVLVPVSRFKVPRLYADNNSRKSPCVATEILSAQLS